MLMWKTCHSAVLADKKKKTNYIFKINIAALWSVPRAGLTHSTNDKKNEFNQELTDDKLY